MAGRGSTFHRAIQGRRWERTRRAVFDRDGWRCVRCGGPGRLECHHVRPLHLGGAPFDLANLETVCRGCHIATHKPPISPERRAWIDLVIDMVNQKCLD